ncbi:hypothetical protein Gotri_006412, partial [Gossypium trilobum]|nr:hypothetical protein [Gossypium trilobum]
MKTEPGLFIPSIKFLIQCFMSFAIMLMVLIMLVFTSSGMNLERSISIRLD